MKKVLPNVTVSATSRITDTSDGKLAYLCNVKRLSQLFYTGPRYLLSHNTTPANWSTMHESLADGFITKYADPLCLLGVGFGLVTAYIMFDIDWGSRNHPSNDPRAFERFLATLHKIGLTTPVIITSSSSGGIHVYYFFDRDINTFRIASLSQVSLIDAKFEIKDGTLELFPNCKDYGNKSNHKPHRSPLQPNGGGLLLDRQGNPLMNGANLNHEAQLAAFLEMAKASARGNDVDKILGKIDPVYEKFKGNPSKYQHTHKKNESEGVREWREKLEVVMSIAWTGFHQTNQLIEQFIEYGVVFLKLNNGKDLFEWAFEAITNANGYKQYCRHQHQIEPRIWDWIDSTLKKEFYVPYCGHPTRSSDRDNFIAKYKHSKARPTTKAEVYLRAKVESVATKIATVVETILSMIDQIPSRTGDLIQLIQKIAHEKFGHSFSNTTLYKLHYKAIWMKLKSTKKVSNMVADTSITQTNIVYRTETRTESAFKGSTFDVTGSSETNLKPIDCETSHRALSVCSVNASSPLPPANEADPDLTPAPDLKKNVPLDPDSYLDLELKHITLNPIDSQSPLIPALPNFDTSYQSDPIEPSRADLISRSAYDRDKLIEPDPIDWDNSTQPDPIHPQSLTNPNLIDLDTNPRFSRIDTSGADLIIRLYPDREQLIEPDPSHLDPKLQARDLSLDPIEPDPIDRDKSIQPIHPQSIPIATLPNLITNPQSNPIEPPGVDLIEIPTHDREQSIQPDPDSSLKYSAFLDQKIELRLQAMKEMRLSDLPLVRGCLVRRRDIHHVHGDDQGIVREIQAYGVHVLWSDCTSGLYAADQLICTYHPNFKS